MITEWTIYWVTRLDSIKVFLSVSLIVMGIYSVGFGIFYGSFFFLNIIRRFEGEVGDIIKYRRFHLWFILPPVFIIICLSLVLPFLPSTKEMIAIYTIPKIVNNEKLQSELSNWYGITKEFIVEKLKDEKGEII